jgi:hypothetical protein
MRLSLINEASAILHTAILRLRPHIAAAAQAVYDSWKPNDEYDDFAGGGICDAISAAIVEMLMKANIDVTEGGHDGDDHAYTIAYNDEECYVVDIPYDLYEMGGGYNWQKIDGVQFNAADVHVTECHRPDWI